MPDLDQRLGAARDELMARIQVPEIAGVQARASRLRRQRRGIAAAGAALAVAAVFGTGTALLDNRPARPGPQPAATADQPAGQRWSGAGLTVLGLNGRVLDLPGDIHDVDFADTRHGYTLAAWCDRGAGENCRLSLAATTDGGRTWIDWALPITEAREDQLPDIVAVGSDGLSLIGDGVWFGRRGGQWQQRPVDPNATVPAIAEGARPLLASVDVGYAAPAVAVLMSNGAIVRLANQPPLGVHWVAPAPAADGAWWVGGMVDGRPAVAVSRDSGRTWAATKLPGTGDGATAVQVSTIGSDVFAATVSRREGDSDVLVVHGVYRSAARGPFNLYATMIGTAVGDVVPLLDGRLLAAGPNWYISAGRNAKLEPAGGSLPWVGRIERTPGYWVVYDFLDAGWTAISGDGVIWQKINVH